ncbi:MULTISPECIES: hypothetical protein [Streptosporangiaceae]|uniref:hypothetical protein n=1 Tax=Streptosporangiaceae TaxID=2004 RepID=UPI0033D5201D
MENRLIPINAVIALATTDGINPAVFADHGYRVAGLEIPVRTPVGSVVIDIVIANGSTGHLLAIESKCGGNVEEAQCVKYAALDATTLVRNAHIDLQRRATPTVNVVYACLGQYVDRVRLGLDRAGVTFPILAIHDRKVVMEGDIPNGPLQKIFNSSVALNAPPLRLIPFDAESSVEIIEPYVQTALVAALNRSLSDVSLATLTEQSIRHFPWFGKQAQTSLKKKVGEAARRIANRNPLIFEYHGPPPNRDGWITLLRTPETNHPSGRTQAYQALSRPGQSKPSRKKSAIIAGQTDLLEELDKADEGTLDSLEVQAEEMP